ncbi:MAG: hypothetical protein PUA75_06130, partial [Clostridiales bacterium]|nr:hypothetical protein [Clostridiales bacterium]
MQSNLSELILIGRMPARRKKRSGLRLEARRGKKRRMIGRTQDARRARNCSSIKIVRNIAGLWRKEENMNWNKEFDVTMMAENSSVYQWGKLET